MCFLKLIFIGVQLIYNVVLVSAAQQSESVIHILISTLFQILFPCRSLQSTEQSSLCYTVGSYQLSILFYFLVDLFIYFWLRWVFVAACRLSLVAASGGYSSLRYAGFSLQWLLLLRSMGSRHAGFSSCGMWAQQLWLTGFRAQAQQLWRMGLVAPQHVGSSQTRAQTRVPCIGRRILNHCATREVPILCIVVCICQSQSPSLSLPLPHPPASMCCNDWCAFR